MDLPNQQTQRICSKTIHEVCFANGGYAADLNSAHHLRRSSAAKFLRGSRRVVHAGARRRSVLADRRAGPAPAPVLANHEAPGRDASSLCGRRGGLLAAWSG